MPRVSFIMKRFLKNTAKKMTEAEFAATFPPAPCGNQTEHYSWTEINGMRCPICAAQNLRQKELDDMDLLAEKVAERVISKIKFLYPKE